MNNGRLIFLKPAKLAGVSLTGAYEEITPRAWEAVFKWLERRAHHDGAGTGYGLSHDDPAKTPPDRCRYTAAVKLPQEWEDEDAQFASQFRFHGGAHVARRCQDVYAKIPQRIAEVRASWKPETGLTMTTTRPVVTLYREDPRARADELLEVDICIPVDFENPSA